MSTSNLENALLIQMRAVGLPDPVREYRFHSKRRWRADFCFIEQKLLVEIEGGVWSGGRHTRGSGYTKDAEKYNEATIEGWRLLRFTGDHVKNGYALNTIQRAILGEIR